MDSVWVGKHRMYVILVITCLHSCVTEAVQRPCLHLDYSRENDNKLCSENYICNKTFAISYVKMPPYYKIFSIKDDILKRCCGKCVNVSVENETRHIHQIKELFESSLSHLPDFIFPFLERAAAIKSQGYYFIPVVRLPNMIYVTPIRQSAFRRAVISCLHLYPLLTICLLMSLISGFFIWIMETKGNAEEFPRPFPIGWIKGIWWSTVTLASTGLENTPKSLPARIFSVIWVVIGVMMLGLLTSLITAAIIKPTPIPTMQGSKVGTLAYQPYNNFMITNHGGDIVTHSEPDIHVEFYKLAESFYLGEIGGILLDKYTLSYVNKHISNTSGSMTENNILKYFTTNTILTEISHIEDMSFGMLVKDFEVYDYFRDPIKDNWLYYETMFASYANVITDDETRRRAVISDYTAPLFSPSDPFVFYAMAGFGATLLLLFISGILYELYRRKSPRKLCAGKRSSAYEMDTAEI